MMKKAIVLLSGGLDSTILAAHMKYVEKREVIGLNVNYGQKHNREIIAANNVAAELNIELIELRLAEAISPLFKGAESSQVGKKLEVPEGHYAAENMKLTLVPNRNMMLIAMAGALAVSRGAEVVCAAIHAGDHAIYPDCRPEFYYAMSRALEEATKPPVLDHVRVYAPFVMMTKADIVKHGWEVLLNVGFMGHSTLDQKDVLDFLALTWSCYQGDRVVHCGKCGTCVERREAFELAGVPDPTEYAS
jgi:7-cyano-7-deazaguanine synthase